LCDVKSAVSCLKSHKNDGGTGLNSYHIINAGGDYFTHIALLFSSFVVRGTVPDSFLRSSIVPIPKGKYGTASESSNFHFIYIVPITKNTSNGALTGIIKNNYNNKLLTRQSD